MRLLNLTDKNLVSLKDVHGESKAKKTLPGTPETMRHVIAVRNPNNNFFYPLRFRNDSFAVEDFVTRKNINFM